MCGVDRENIIIGRYGKNTIRENNNLHRTLCKKEQGERNRTEQNGAQTDVQTIYTIWILVV